MKQIPSRGLVLQLLQVRMSEQKCLSPSETMCKKKKKKTGSDPEREGGGKFRSITTESNLSVDSLWCRAASVGFEGSNRDIPLNQRVEGKSINTFILNLNRKAGLYQRLKLIQNFSFSLFPDKTPVFTDKSFKKGQK